MNFRNPQALLGLIVLALLIPQQSVFALLNIDGTRNQVFVFGSATISYDSNVFAENSERGDYILAASAGLELKRRAGIIAVNVRATFDYQQFSEYTDQTTWNPSFFVELNKTTGRTTGALTVNAFRSSKADSAVNLRTQSWNYPVGLNIKYPINDKLYVTSATGYLKRSYTDSVQLLSYTDYSESIDVFYVYTSKLDLVGGYRLRVGSTNLSTTTDHNFSLGATNGLLPKVNGTVRLGYQFRTIDSTGRSYSQLNAMVSLTWLATRKFTMSNQTSRDFTTTATGGSVDTLSTALRAVYVFTRRFEASAGVGYGRNLFLDGPARQDDYFTWDVGLGLNWSEHLRVAASFNYMLNWSSFALSDFERTGYSLNVSSRF